MNYFGSQSTGDTDIGDTIVARYAYPGISLGLGNMEMVPDPTAPGKMIERYVVVRDKCFDRKAGKFVYMSNCKMQAGESKIAAGAKGALSWLLEPLRQSLAVKPAAPGAPPTFWEKYKTPIIIGGVAFVALGGVAMLTKKKRKRS